MTTRETLAAALQAKGEYWGYVIGPSMYDELAGVALEVLGLDDLPALAQRGAIGLADGPWSYEGVGHKRDEIAHAVLSAAFTAPERTGGAR